MIAYKEFTEKVGTIKKLQNVPTSQLEAETKNLISVSENHLGP